MSNTTNSRKRQMKRCSDAYWHKCGRRLLRGWRIYILAILILCIYSICNTTRVTDAEEYNDSIEGMTSTELTTEMIAYSAYTTVMTTTTSDEATITETTTIDNDIYLLAQLIHAEAGDECTDEHKLWVGQVVLNRARHSGFPNTIKDVIYQQGQYGSVDNGAINNIPSERSLQCAKSLLNGFVMDKDVIWQAEFPQGETVAVLDTGYSVTYIGK